MVMAEEKSSSNRSSTTITSKGSGTVLYS